MDLTVVMGNERNGYPQSTTSLSETLVNQPGAAVVGMDNSAIVATGEDGEVPPRIKFLCSFGGSILPRPLDGKLRYVGGETRIVSVPRDVSYDELMSRMQEIFEGAAVLKYQQPDEDLDALVSVVNDDDVMNMMEEYDKLGAGDGFTRLRLFLFSHPDHHDASPRFDSDERETERRYVDALNSLTDAAPEFRKLQPELERIHGPLSGGGGEVGGLHNQWNPECSLPPINVHHIAVPHTLPHSARYNEMEAPWSPAYYSPGPQVPHDARSISEFPSSPSSGRYRMPFGDLHDKTMDRMAEEYGRHPAFVENVVWMPPGVIGNDKAGFPGNLGHSHNVFEGNNICGHCHMTFQRNQAMPEGRYPDSRWRHGQSSSHIDQPGTGNEFSQFPTPCTECLPGHDRETYVLNPDTKLLDHGIYSKEQSEQRPFYNETHNQDRGWVLHHHQMNHHAEEARTHVSGAGRVSEHYVVDGGTSMNFPFAHDGHTVSSNCINHDDPRYIRPGIELGNEGFHDQTVGAGHHMHIPPLEDSGIRYGNLPPAYGMDNHYQVPHGSTTMHSLWRKVQNPIRGGPSYEVSGLLPQANGTANPGFLRGEGSPRLPRVGVEDQNPWVGHYCGPQQKVFGFDGSAAPEYPHEHAVKPNSVLLQENQQSYTLEPIPCQPEMLDISVPLQAVTLVPSPLTVMEDQVANSTISGYHLNPTSDTGIGVTMTLRNEQNVAYETKHVQPVKEPDVKVLSSLKGDQVTEYDSNGAVEDGNATKLEEGVAGAHDAFAQGEFSAQCLSYLPDLIASVKKAALEGAEVNMKGNDDVHVSPDADMKQTSALEADPVNANNEVEHDSDSDQPDISKIEPTKAEEEALAKGLQTIKNDDLEEIRMLGSGTYGAVYHSKWKGSDVAVKRIKASCFAGKPSERERLIADFWKEALILSSLHHPNVVSFYGIVRDGPDGTLATVTEFMVNGSLKQFLQKKDRTIDRRKRLIIAMDAAFGMEYLHGKNIVHFDLKCENLLVNMRDPHRPVCKIGDLGLSKVKQHTLVSGGIRGTLPWMAPELLSGKSSMVTEKIDIYSFGIVMWELLTGEEPYGDMHCASIIGGIVNNTLRPQIPTWCDPEWKSLMESCWSSDTSERPSFSEISQKLRKMAAAMNVK